MVDVTKVGGLVVDESCLAQGTIIASKLRLPMWYRRNKVKEHGKKGRIEGDLRLLSETEGVLWLRVYD